MRVRIDRTRMAMPGRFYAYDVTVPVADCPQIQACQTTTIIRDGRAYYSYVAATLPAEHWQMEKGWERYQQYTVHEEACKAKMLTLAKRIYSELDEETAWPCLWVELRRMTMSRPVNLPPDYQIAREAQRFLTAAAWN